ncbi:MAG: hypothetical protein AB1609_10170 [Bacillota bacterium]
MPDRVLDLRPRIDEEKLRLVEDELDGLGPEDTLTLVFEREDSHETEPIVKLLHERGLGWQPKGGHRDTYAIHVGRKFTLPRGPDEDR